MRPMTFIYKGENRKVIYLREEQERLLLHALVVDELSWFKIFKVMFAIFRGARPQDVLPGCYRTFRTDRIGL